MTDSNLPPSFDENAGEDAEIPLGEYDALPDEPDRLGDDEEFDAIDITQNDGPDLEAGDDLDTGAAGSGGAMSSSLTSALGEGYPDS